MVWRPATPNWAVDARQRPLRKLCTPLSLKCTNCKNLLRNLNGKIYFYKLLQGSENMLGLEFWSSGFGILNMLTSVITKVITCKTNTKLRSCPHLSLLLIFASARQTSKRDSSRFPLVSLLGSTL